VCDTWWKDSGLLHRTVWERRAESPPPYTHTHTHTHTHTPQPGIWERWQQHRLMHLHIEESRTDRHVTVRRMESNYRKMALDPKTLI
jgi:hypothetical protein